MVVFNPHLMIRLVRMAMIFKVSQRRVCGAKQNGTISTFSVRDREGALQELFRWFVALNCSKQDIIMDCNASSSYSLSPKTTHFLAAHTRIGYMRKWHFPLGWGRGGLSTDEMEE